MTVVFCVGVREDYVSFNDAASLPFQGSSLSHCSKDVLEALQPITGPRIRALDSEGHSPGYIFCFNISLSWHFNFLELNLATLILEDIFRFKTAVSLMTRHQGDKIIFLFQW